MACATNKLGCPMSLSRSTKINKADQCIDSHRKIVESKREYQRLVCIVYIVMYSVFVVLTVSLLILLSKDKIYRDKNILIPYFHISIQQCCAALSELGYDRAVSCLACIVH